MEQEGLTTSDDFLTNAAVDYFNNLYENPGIVIAEEISSNLGWVPSLHFKSNAYITIAAEVSQTPYPAILRLRHADILHVQTAISIFCVCPEEAFLNESFQKDVRNLQSHGHGLLTVDSTGHVTKRFGCVPLIQHITDEEITEGISKLPRNVRLAIKEAHESYRGNPGSGVKELSEVLEAVVISAGKKAVKKQWIPQSKPNGPLAGLLKALDDCGYCNAATAAIGGAKGYVSEVRNTAHHTPRSRRQAYIKYEDCAHGFREGMRRIRSFIDAMSKIGIKPSI